MGRKWRIVIKYQSDRICEAAEFLRKLAVGEFHTGRIPESNGTPSAHCIYPMGTQSTEISV